MDDVIKTFFFFHSSVTGHLSGMSTRKLLYLEKGSRKLNVSIVKQKALSAQTNLHFVTSITRLRCLVAFRRNERNLRDANFCGVTNIVVCLSKLRSVSKSPSDRRSLSEYRLPNSTG